MDSDDVHSSLADIETVAAPRRRRPLLWVVSGVVVVALVAAALALTGNGNDTKSATLVLSQAAARTTTSTARVRLRGDVTLAGHTTTILNAEGATDYGTKTTRLQMSIGPTTEEVRSVHDVAYLSVSSVALPHGAHWVSLTKADVKVDPAADSTIKSSDPSSGLQFLSAVSGNPRVVGKEQVDGTDVTHYAFTLDLKAFFDQMGEATKQLNASSIAEGLKALGSVVDLTSIPGEAWIDGNGRVRKFDIKIEATVDGQTLQVVDEFFFSHFNEPVIVPAPPASDTVPFRSVPNLFAQIAKSAGQTGTS